MSFKRSFLPAHFSTGEQLSSELAGIGFRLATTSKKNANIEDSLIAASLEGLKNEDRLLSLLVDWMLIHHERVNVDRLTLLIKSLYPKQEKRFLILWSALGQILQKDTRFKRLAKLAPKKRFDYLEDRTDFLIEKNGEDPRFLHSVLRVPHKVLRHRPNDILTPQELAQIHLAYCYRVLMGPTYRSDMWALLSQEPELKISELARKCYGSYPTAFMVKNDFELLQRRSVQFIQRNLVPEQN